MDDLISRQAAIDTIYKRIKQIGYEDNPLALSIRQAIRDLPSIQPEQHWIPWNNGILPKDSGWYVVTAYDGNRTRVTFVKYQKRMMRWDLTGSRAYWRVLAWMPLPEPYRGDENG